MNKCLARLFSAFIRERNLRHKVRDILLEKTMPGSTSKGRFFIPENIGGSFKKYFLQENICGKIARLKNNLDEQSAAFVDALIERMLNFPEQKYASLAEVNGKEAFNALATAGEREIVRIKNETFPNMAKHYKFPHMAKIPDYLAAFLLFCNGLYFLKEKGAEYVRDKDILDIGASFGDSALGLLKCYNPRKVYSFDVSGINIELYKKTMELNAIHTDRYEIIDNAVSDKRGTVSVRDREDLTSLIDADSAQAGRNVETVILDQFVEQRSLRPKFVKIDVEGFELACVRGMEGTIKKHRPILSISIYHNPEQFFELKPLIESYTADLNYRHEIRPLCFDPATLIDYVLFAYPEELT